MRRGTAKTARVDRQLVEIKPDAAYHDLFVIDKATAPFCIEQDARLINNFDVNRAQAFTASV